MAHSPAPALVLRDGDDEELRRWTRSSTMPSGHAQWARIVLLASEGVANTEIAVRVGVARQTVLTWRDRYTRYGLEGLGIGPGPGVRRRSTRPA